MQVTKKKSEKLRHELNVKVPARDIDSKANERLAQIAKTVKMPGFRPGKVPLDLVKKNYGQSIRGEILEKIVNETSNQAILDQKLRPALKPKIEIISFDEGKDLEYSMEIEVFPEIQPLDYTKISLTQYKTTPAEKDVQESLDALAAQAKEFAAVERAAKKGDAVRIDFKGFHKDIAFAGGEGKNYRLELGSNSFIPGFEDQLIGTKAGDKKKINVTFPEAYHKEDLAGEPAMFEVTVHEVLEAKKPEINDELAKKFGLESAAKLKEEIGKRLQQEFDTACRTLCKRELFDKLDEKASFEVSEQMVENELNAIWSQMTGHHHHDDGSTCDHESHNTEEKEKFRKTANRRVRLGVLLSETGNKEGIKVDQRELVNAMLEQARQYPGQEAKVIEYYKSRPELLQEFSGPILEEKVVDFILGKVTLEEKPISTDALKAKLETLEKEAADGQEDGDAKPAKASKTEAKKETKSTTKKESGKK